MFSLRNKKNVFKWSSIPGGEGGAGEGGAKVPVKISVPGRPTSLDDSRLLLLLHCCFTSTVNI